MAFSARQRAAPSSPPSLVQRSQLSIDPRLIDETYENSRSLNRQSGGNEPPQSEYVNLRDIEMQYASSPTRSVYPSSMRSEQASISSYMSNTPSSRHGSSRQARSQGRPLPTDGNPFSPAGQTAQVDDERSSGTLQRSPKTRFRPEQVKPLKSWYKDHSRYAYPSSDEKAELAKISGLTPKQVHDWFINQRKRDKNRPASTRSDASRAPRSIAVSDYGDISNDLEQGEEPSDSITQDLRSRESSSSLERWEITDPKEEPAPFVLRSLQNTDEPRNFQFYHFRNDHDDSPSTASLHPKIPHSIGSRASFTTSEPMRRNETRSRLIFSENKPPERPQREGNKKYQCVECYKGFSDPNGWKRHETSVCLPLTKYICMREGPCITDLCGQRICAFCRHRDPTDEHLQKNHKILQGLQGHCGKEFSRPDIAVRHMRSVHSGDDSISFPDTWNQQVDRHDSQRYLYCGFCMKNDFKTLDERYSHIREHFDQGDDMTKWNPYNEAGFSRNLFPTDPTINMEFSYDNDLL